MTTVRTRFAPSPTGLLHIGGARTALFNYLFARHHGGTFLLRIEDTDRERSTEQATQVILEGLHWLGLDPDEPPLYQSTRRARHIEVAEQLVAAGRAYRCYMTAAELDERRAQAKAEGRGRVESPWRDRDPAEAPPGAPFAIRIRVPRDGETVVDDLVQGEVRVANAELDDMIILRSDRWPTYQHAVVVDDHDMGITHVIRGDDHFTNTFRQVQLYDAMGWSTPRFGHVPLIHGADGHKLSKRHGAQSVTEFRALGYLPEALCNYLLRLGWGHGDAEILSRDEAIALFDIDGVGRAPSRMDYAKLRHVNGHWLRAADEARLADETLARLAGRPGLIAGAEALRRVHALLPALKERAHTLVELADAAAFLLATPPLAFEPKARALLTAENRAMLVDLGRLLAATAFGPEPLEAALRGFAERTGRKLGAVAQPLRAALTGSTASPGIEAVLIALGKEESLARISIAAAQ
jgi:glutamyl-tRNA synthetase